MTYEMYNDRFNVCMKNKHVTEIKCIVKMKYN